MQNAAAGSVVAARRWIAHAGPRVSLQLLRVLPDIAGLSPHSPTSVWGFELYAAAAQELTGAAAGTPVTYGVSFLGF